MSGRVVNQGKWQVGGKMASAHFEIGSQTLSLANTGLCFFFPLSNFVDYAQNSARCPGLAPALGLCFLWQEQILPANDMAICPEMIIEKAHMHFPINQRYF